MDFNIENLFQQQKRYFVPRYLDSPLLADKLDERVWDAVHNTGSNDGGRLIRRQVNQLIKGRDVTFCSECMGSTHAISGRIEGCTGRHIVPVCPNDLLLLTYESHRPLLNMSLEESVLKEQAALASALLEQEGITIPKKRILTEDTRRWFGLEDVFLNPQRKLVAERGRGSKSLILAACASYFGTRACLSDKFVVLGSPGEGDLKVMTYDMYTCVLDTVRKRARLSLGMDLLGKSDALREAVDEQVEWQRGWIRAFGNAGYDLAKQTEALTKTLLSERTDDILGEDGPYPAMKEKILAKARKLEEAHPGAEEVAKYQLSWFESYTEPLDLKEIVELFGLQKLVCHPFIYVREAGKSAAAEASKLKDIDPVAISELRGAWCAMFCAGFMASNKRWPGLRFAPSAKSTQIFKWYTARYTNLSQADIPIDEWDGIAFEQEFDFNYHENFLELLDDKAVSFLRDEAAAYWDDPNGASTSGRLLLEIMKRETFSIRSIVDKIEAEGVPHNWKIVCLCPKEKEMKTEARMFAIMVPEMRCAMACTEANLAEHVFPYLSAQTMTKDKVSIDHILANMTTPRAEDGILHIFIECDLSRWNLLWRASVVNRVGADLNDLFGLTRMYTFAHDFFEDAIIIVRTKDMRPDGIELENPPAGDLIFYGWRGGFEGLLQKLWTILTYAMIERALRKLLCSKLMIGQGDNQILSLVAPQPADLDRKEAYRGLVKKVLAMLEEGCADVNQNLKPEECIASLNVLTYGKIVQIGGMRYHTSLKFLSTCFERSHDEIPSFVGELTALWSSALAAADHTEKSVELYLMASFLFARAVVRRSQEESAEWDGLRAEDLKRLRSITSDKIIQAIWLPSRCGGLSICSPLDFIHRGSADPLSKDLAVLMRASCLSQVVAPVGQLVLDRTFLSATPDRKDLLQDPYGLPLVKCQSPMGHMTRLVGEYLAQYTVNRDLAVFKMPEYEVYSELLATILIDTSPFNPKLGRDIFTYSVAHEVERLTKMFVTTRTVQKDSRLHGIDASANILTASGLEFYHKLRLVLTIPSRRARLIWTFVRDYRLAFSLREAWGTGPDRVVGVNAVVPEWFPVRWAREITDTVGVKLVATLPPEPLSVRGPETPYLGARTVASRSEHGFKIVGDSRPLRAVKNLREIYSLSNLSSNMKRLVQDVARARSQINFSDSTLQGAITGGSTQHRYQSQRSEQGSFTLSTGWISTHCVMISDELPPITGSTLDFPVMFQEFYTYLIGILGLAAAYGQAPLGYLELVSVLPADDIDPIDDATLDVVYDRELQVEGMWSESHMLYSRGAVQLMLTGPLSTNPRGQDRSFQGVASPLELLHALRAEMMVRLTGTGLVSALVDGVSGVRRPLNIDLSEAVRIGYKSLVSAAAVTGALEVGVQWMSDISSPKPRSTVEHYLRHVSESLAEAILRLLSNPAHRHDPDAIGIVATSHPLYGGRGRSPKEHLTLEIFREAEKTLREMHKETRPILLYGSERGGTTSRMLMARLGATLYGLWRLGASATLIRDIAVLPQVYLGDDTPMESRRIANAKRLLAEAAKMTRGDLLLGPALQAASIRSWVQLVAHDHRLVIRSVRQLSPPPSLPVEDPTALSSLVVYSEDLVTTVDSIVTRDHASLSPYRQQLAWRYQQVGRSLSVHYEPWAFMMSPCRARPVVFVGVGFGVGARAALDLGAETVTGFDLASAYPLRSLRLGLPPPEVQISGRRTKFRWGHILGESEFTWESASSRTASYSLMPDDSIVVVDVQPYRTPAVYWSWTSDVRPDLIYGTRFFCSLTEVKDRVLEFAAYFDLYQVRAIHRYGQIQAMAFGTRRVEPVHLLSPERIATVMKTLRLVEVTATASSNTRLLVDVLTVLWDDLTWGFRPIFHWGRARARLVRMAGEYSSRQSYDNWTLVLARVRALDWMMTTARDPADIAAILSDDHTFVTMARGGPLKILVTSEMRRLLIEVCLRLASAPA
ncbi:RNA-dependent RNA polymerase [Auricularia heimuer negative-stranded RNA virus 1]|uniref:RNA-directed RNA polymerase n=1 Tax=Auricularia heimuer negative-stranded RNA virus 1 TaxID=2732257 RepID=A0A6M3Z8I5_9MONO|nr:RNA-dependent RNA polymerase [Auricularia heimuer negative-stranded RNA virus 1]QJP04103.1 RNA-dependent RNA polymerase [Auricularia heimuer negative-stranded RNA virus 1]